MPKTNGFFQLLDSLTMYKAVLFSLLFLFLYTFGASLFGYTFFKPTTLVVSLFLITLVTVGSNYLLSKLYKVSPNPESALITSLILLFLFSPASTKTEYYTLVIAGTIASASKYIFNYHQVHIFNPAAIAAVITPLLGFDGAIWWVATPVILPSTLLVAIYLINKLRREKLVLSYLAGLLVGLLLTKQLTLNNSNSLFLEVFLSWPTLFFMSIMLTEPLTMPNKNSLINSFGLFVGLLSTIPYHFSPFFSTPELNLTLGNILSFIVSNKKRYNLQLIKKDSLTPNTIQLSFLSQPPITFSPGQYLEWSLPHQNADIRGFRRYFTISSSPTEKEIQLTFKISPNSSSFKNSILELNVGDNVTASHLAGDFTPHNKVDDMVFIAGGIGITPFRSIIKYFLDKNLKKNIYLLYASTNQSDFVYKSLFEQAKKQIGLKTEYFVSSQNQRITPETIKKIEAYQKYTYFISGPDAMVQHYKKMLQSLGLKSIKTDYFPGF